jgi:hypothetical protein
VITFAKIETGNLPSPLPEIARQMPFRKGGRATTLLKGSGVLREFDKLTATLECFKENLADLPSSFGGTSGGGLWRSACANATTIALRPCTIG